jgi:hypothetical protein
MKAPSLLLLLVLSAATIAVPAQNPTNTDRTAPAYDMKAQSLLDLQRVQKRFVDLTNAVPADKLTWRPSPAARSFAEVFLHVAGERYGILALMGATPNCRLQWQDLREIHNRQGPHHRRT